jgi:predicted short-subunit dehydrogenase-like oxidoreductase (DUF2520 family)
MKITLIGAGKLGKQLYCALLAQSHFKLVEWVDRSNKESQTAEGISITNDLNTLKATEIYVLAVSDQAIETISQILPKDAFVVHTAGSVSIDAIQQERKGVFYPIQSFSENRIIQFSKVTIGIETQYPEDRPLLQLLAECLGAQYISLNSKQREQLHLAAVLVNNFTNHLFTEAANLCEKNDLPFELLMPLIQETVQKLQTHSPKAAQTGPAIRNDIKTINKHIRLIEKPHLKEIYKAVTSSIQKNYEY